MKYFLVFLLGWISGYWKILQITWNHGLVVLALWTNVMDLGSFGCKKVLSSNSAKSNWEHFELWFVCLKNEFILRQPERCGHSVVSTCQRFGISARFRPFIIFVWNQISALVLCVPNSQSQKSKFSTIKVSPSALWILTHPAETTVISS